MHIGQYLTLCPIILLVCLFPLISHPLLMGLIILTLTFFLGVTLGLTGAGTWLSYVLVLILLGGLLVIFIYVSLLASNETQAPQKKEFGVIIITSGRIFLASYFLSSNLEIFESKSSALLPVLTYTSENTYWITLLYSDHLGSLTIFLVLYLLLTLIVVVFITKNDSSSLRAS